MSMRNAAKSLKKVISFLNQIYPIEICSLYGNLSIDIPLGTTYIISVHIISVKMLHDYYARNKETEDQLKTWYHEIKRADWNSPQDVKAKYKTASIIGGKRIMFNIKGNKYRLVTKINHKMKVVFIRFIGTHKEYDKINAEEI